MTIEKVKIEDIKKNPNNPRTIKDDSFKKLVKSIKEFPQMLEIRPIVVDDNMIVLGGNMRLKACKEAGLKEIPIIKASELTDEQKSEFIIKDNVGYGEWDFDILNSEWDTNLLSDWGLDVPKSKNDDDELVKNKLSDSFIVPPFSILDTRQGDWQDRKLLWNKYLKELGESREESLVSKTEIKYGRKVTEGDDDIINSWAPTVSLFDPVLAEVCFHWFAPIKSNIIDPFAGDIRKGAVAGFLNHNFTGIELRKEQYDINNKQIDRLSLNDNVKYICDDGSNISKYVNENSQDLIFSCPPYYNLEKYSKMENDASNQNTYEDFIGILDNAFTESIKCLKNDRFAVVVVGDLRDKSGYYYNFHEDIKFIFNKNNMFLYNELILIETSGTAALRANSYMKNRKVIKTNQNVLVFYKPGSDELPKIESVYRKIFIFHKGDIKNIKSNFNNLSNKIT